MATTDDAEQINLPLFQQSEPTSEDATQQTNTDPEKPKRLIKEIRTMEFPIVISNQQKEKLEEICDNLTTIWNIGLKRLLEFDEKTGHYSKENKRNNPCCPINWEYRYQWLNEQGAITSKQLAKEKIKVPFTRIVDEATVKPRGSTPYLGDLKSPKMYSGKIGSEKVLSHLGERDVILTTHELSNIQGVIPERGCSGFSCPIRPSWGEVTNNLEPLPYQEPLLKNYQYTASGGIGQAIKTENLEYHPASEDLLAVPYKFRSGTIKALSISWQEYDKSRRGKSTGGIFRGKPKFKRKHRSSEKVKTIVHPNPKDVIVPCEDDLLKGIPALKTVKTIGLSKRWRNYDGSFPKISYFKFVQRPFGWTVQLTGEMDVNQKLRKSKGIITADVGLQHAIIFDNGKFIDNPRWYRGRKDRIAKIQRQISEKRTHRLILWLNHPERTVEDIKALANISEKDAEILLQTRSEQEGKTLIGQKRWEQLKRKCLPDSNAIKKLEQRLRHQHFKISQARKAFWNRLSTWLVRNYEVFICEDGLQKEGLRHQAEAKYEQGEAKPNQKKVKSGLTISLSDLAPGMFMEQCKRKFKEAERTFIPFPAKNSTLECPICDSHNHMEGNYPGQMYQCANCGYEENRDQKAGIYIAVKAWEKNKVAFDLLSEPSKNAVLGRIDWQEKQKQQTKGKRKSKKKSSK
jgi:putative transposase